MHTALVVVGCRSVVAYIYPRQLEGLGQTSKLVLVSTDCITSLLFVGGEEEEADAQGDEEEEEEKKKEYEA